MAEIGRPSRLRLRPAEQRLLILFGDLIAAIAALVGALITWKQYSLYVLISKGIPEARALRLLNIDVPGWFYILPAIWLLLLVELYDPHSAADWRKTLRGIAITAFVGMAAYSVIFTTFRDPNSLPRIGVGVFVLYASILTLLWRLVYIRIYTSSGFQRRILVVGAGKAGRTLADMYALLSPPPFHLVGYIDDDPKKIGERVRACPILAGSDRLLEIVESQHISDVVVAINGAIRGTTFQTLLDMQEQGVEIVRMTTLYEELTGRVPIHHLESDWIIRSFVDEARVSGLYEVAKRALDIVGSLVGMLIFLSVLPFAALATILDSGFPVFYSQTRSGKGGAGFRIYKFRTMRQDAEVDGRARLAQKQDPRITRVGNFLRITRLDELPQFWNVLRGEMSLVGPRAERPELVSEFQKQIPFYRARLLVKPGLTGWAQVSYGYVATVEDTAVKLEYDLYYIKHRNLWLDAFIMLRTIGTVLGRRGR
jgi:exopolysaccharide biosynthesis polyprenyl glycosylphosphotransferase